MDKKIASLKVVGFMEGVSFVVLLFIAMPLKYLFAMPIAVKIVGMAHGILFLAFLWVLYEAVRAHRLNLKFAAYGFVASILPFGTFVFDKKMLQTEQLEAYKL